MNLVSLLLAGVVASGLLLVVRRIIATRRTPAPMAAGSARSPLELSIGFITDFFDTLGIGSFATTTAVYRLLRVVPDEPHRRSFIARGGTGAVLHHRDQRRSPPDDGAHRLVRGRRLARRGRRHAALAALGVGNYAPNLILFRLLGMDPRAVGSGAFVGPIAAVRFVDAARFHWRAALGLAAGGIHGVIVAAVLVKSLPLGALRWLVLVVVAYAALTLPRAGARGVLAPVPIRRRRRRTRWDGWNGCEPSCAERKTRRNKATSAIRGRAPARLSHPIAAPTRADARSRAPGPA